MNDAPTAPHEDETASTDDIVKTLRSSMLGLPDEAVLACREELVQGLQPPDQPRLVEVGLFEKQTYYAIHNKELNLLGEAASAGAKLWQNFSQNGLQVVGRLVLFLFRYRRLRAKLSEIQGLVLLTLKGGPTSGMTPEEIRDNLPLREKPPVEEIRRTLTTLRNMTLTDGKTKAEFVVEQDDYWKANDV